MLKMFPTAFVLCVTLVPIFSHPQLLSYQGINSMTHVPQHIIHPMLPQQNIPPMFFQHNIPQMIPQQNMPQMIPQQNIPQIMHQQNTPPITPDNQGYSLMHPIPVMLPLQRMAQDYQPPTPDNSIQEQLLLLIMSACNRLMAYIQLLANQSKVPQYNPLHDPTGLNMNLSPGLMSYSPQLPVEAQQNYQNQLLHQQQYDEYQQLLIEEQQLQEEEHKEAEAKKQNSVDLNLEAKNEELKKHPEKDTKIIPQDSLKTDSTRDHRHLPKTAINNSSDVEQKSYSNDMYIGIQYLPHIYEKPTKYSVFQTLPGNIDSFYSNQDVEQNIKQQRNEPLQQQQFIQSNNQELNEKLKYEDQNLNQRQNNPIKRYSRNSKTQIPHMSDSSTQNVEKGLTYHLYLINKLQEKKQQFKDREEKELKQPWKNPKDRSKFLHSLYIDHLLHEEHDHEKQNHEEQDHEEHNHEEHDHKKHDYEEHDNEEVEK